MSTPERWWILDPMGHRALERADPVPETMEFLGETVPVIQSGTDLDLDDWVCDWCNDPIPVKNDVGVVPVPMYLSNALCPKCVRRELEALRLPLLASEWSHWHCSCTACKEMLALHQITGFR